MSLTSYVDAVDDGTAADVVVVFGPIAAVEKVVGRLIECGDLADAEPVVAYADDPVRGSCVLRMADRGGRGSGGGRRAAPTGFLVALAALLRRPDPDTARRQGEPGRHRARA
ncbi:hypothetical protein OG216_47720 (plasmid) [Streptomycetaceae bacterium NBC_01309]